MSISKNSPTLMLNIAEDFMATFNTELFDEDFTEVEDGYEVDFRDYDLNKYGDYRHSSLVEECRLENDGRGEDYIRVYSHFTNEDY